VAYAIHVRKWPPLLWPAISIASLLILMGSGGNRTLLVVGLVMALVAFGIAVYLGLGERRLGPRPRAAYWFFALFAMIYVVSAVVAAASLGWAYALAALLAGVIPLTSVSLIIAAARAKTEQTPEGLRDAAAEAHDDPYPAIGIDDSTPLGHSPEVSDVLPDEERARRLEAARARRFG
jgi:hypothetical protein